MFLVAKGRSPRKKNTSKKKKPQHLGVLLRSSFAPEISVVILLMFYGTNSTSWLLVPPQEFGVSVSLPCIAFEKKKSAGADYFWSVSCFRIRRKKNSQKTGCRPELMIRRRVQGFPSSSDSPAPIISSRSPAFPLRARSRAKGNNRVGRKNLLMRRKYFSLNIHTSSLRAVHLFVVWLCVFTCVVYRCPATPRARTTSEVLSNSFVRN